MNVSPFLKKCKLFLNPINVWTCVSAVIEVYKYCTITQNHFTCENACEIKAVVMDGKCNPKILLLENKSGSFKMGKNDFILVLKLYGCTFCHCNPFLNTCTHSDMFIFCLFFFYFKRTELLVCPWSWNLFLLIVLWSLFCLFLPSEWSKINMGKC